MMYHFLLYLVEATACLGVFSLAYQLVFSRLTHFQWNRFYLVSIALLSVLIPLVRLPLSFHDFLSVPAPEPITFHTDSYSVPTPASPAPSPVTPTETISSQTHGSPVDYNRIPDLLLALYLLGSLYKAWRFGQNIMAVYRLIRTHPQSKEAGYRLVYTSHPIPAFSFLHFIFLGRAHHQLSAGELAQVMRHERVHVEQRHTLDLLLYEVMAVFFWFNPLVSHLKKSLQEVHEYLADAVVTREMADHRLYQRLLLKLAMQGSHPVIASSFSAQQLKMRILMLNRLPAKPRQKLWFALAFPLLALLVVGCSLLRPDAEVQPSENTPSRFGPHARVGKITWLGNTMYSDETLNRALNLQQGDRYEENDFYRRLLNSPRTTDVASLYMNKGCGFFDVNVKETAMPNHWVDLEMHVYEGPLAKIGRILFRGDSQAPRSEVLRLIGISPGELYDRSKIMQSRQALINSDLLDLHDIKQIPHPDQGTLDLEYDISKPYNAVLRLFPDDKVIGLILINGQTLKGVKMGMKGTVSIKVENQELLSHNQPIGLTIEARNIFQTSDSPKVPSFTRTWKDYRQVGNFDISEAISHSQPGEGLSFRLVVNEKLASVTFLSIRE